MPKHSDAPIAAHATGWQSVILVCRKCSKKLDGGFGADGDETLTRVLKRALRDGGERRVTQVIESQCLGLCPKGAVTVLPGHAPGALLAIPAGTAAASVLAMLTRPARLPAPEPLPRQSAVPGGGS